jgi:pimeloyl-ACP methyl ester carboxylesterase
MCQASPAEEKSLRRIFGFQNAFASRIRSLLLKGPPRPNRTSGRAGWFRAIALTVELSALVFLGAACHRPNASAKRLPALKPCKMEGIKEEILCGKLRVFENRATRSGRTIALNVVVLPALDHGSILEPLFDLAGGPGVAATGAANFYANEGKEYRRHGDVVLVDQRGTGNSNPLAAAPRTKNPQDYLTEMYPVKYVETLRQELEQKADLTQYTTSIAMDDLDDVRAWLGYERINLFGLSYGTRAVLVYLRQHPDRVRSAVLMGVAPTYLKMPLYHAQAARRAMDLLLEECASDGSCHQAFPHLQRDWEEVLERLGREPARVEYSPPDKSAMVTVEVHRDIFAEKLRSRMYSRQSARRIPLIVHQAAQGDFSPFLKEVIPANRSEPDFIADGTYLSVTCAEDVPFIDPDQAAKLNTGNPFGNYRVFQQTRACRLWPQGQIPEGYHEPVTSDAPVLIFSGQMDPVTPPQGGEEVARRLPKSRHIVIPQGGHGIEGLTNPECVDRLVLEFLSTGTAKDLDTSCVGQMHSPPFVTNASK